jgi:transposase
MEPLSPDSRIVEYPLSELTDWEKDNTLLKPYGIGIDCHSKFYQLCIYIKKDESLLKYDFTFGTAMSEIRYGYQYMIGVLKQHNLLNADEPIHYTCESTGPYHRPLTIIWRNQPSIINPLLATPSRRKTDVLDARLLAHYDITGLFPKSYIQTEGINIAKALISMYRKHKKLKVQSSNKINNILTYFGNTIGANAGSINKASVRPFIEDLIAGVDVIHDAILERPPENICKIITQLYADIDICLARIEYYLKEAIKQIKQLEFKDNNGGIIPGEKLFALLKTVPGVGDVGVAIFIIEIGDINRFPNPKSLVSYCGFDPSLKISAGKITSHTMRKGNKFLHTAIMRSANVLLVKKNEPFGRWGYIIRVRNSNGGFKKASSAIGRRLVTGLYWVWKTNSVFSYEKYRLFEEYKVDTIPISECNFSTRVNNLLIKNNITDTEKLLTCMTDLSIFVKGLGSKALEEIELWLKQHKKSQKMNQSQDKN